MADVRVTGEIDVAEGPNFSMNEFASALKDRLGPLADKFMNNIVSGLAGLDRDSAGLLTKPDLGRCIFARQDHLGGLPTQCPAKTKPDGSAAVQTIPAVIGTVVRNNALIVQHGICR